MRLRCDTDSSVMQHYKSCSLLLLNHLLLTSIVLKCVEQQIEDVIRVCSRLNMNSINTRQSIGKYQTALPV